LSLPDARRAAAAEPVKRKGLLNSVAFLGRPRLVPIASPTVALESIPSPAVANDDNWTIGYGRKQTTPIDTPAANMATAVTTLEQPIIQQASGMTPLPAQTLAPIPTTPPQALNVVPAHRIDAVRAETAGASVDGLTMILSRLMAAQASGLETEPVAEAARAIATSTSDTVLAGRARLLADRADQYERIAVRRDGSSLVRSTGDVALGETPGISMNGVSQAIGFQPATPALMSSIQMPAAQTPTPEPTAPPAPEFVGQLVQVYSARSNVPPFAITDHTGRTIAYVTPTPGVNLRNHLNSRVNVIGDSGYLPGLNMPHVLATGCVRAIE
jgi:hypothetical protein